MNRTTIIGKLGKDPEFFDRGNFKVVRLFLYYSRFVGKDQQGQSKFDFENFDVEIQHSVPTGNGQQNGFQKVDETAKFMQLGLRKGDKLWVECTQKSSRSVDKQTQQEKVYKHLIVTDWEVLRADQPQQQQPAPGYAQPQPQQYAPPAGPSQYAHPTAGPGYAAPAPAYQPPAQAPVYQQAPPQQPQQYAPPQPPPQQAQPQQPQPQFAPSTPLPPAYTQPQQYAPPAPPQAGGPVPVAPPPTAQFQGGRTAPF